MQQMAPMQTFSNDNVAPQFEIEVNEDADDTGEDVHFHTFTNVQLPAKARLSLPIFSVCSTLSDVYRAKVDNNGKNDRSFEVWHALKVPNKTNKPWTTAPVMVMKGDRFLAQGKVNYTPVGQEAIVDIAKALSVRVVYEESAAKNYLLEKAEYSSWFSYTSSTKRLYSRVVTTKILISNGKPMPIDLVIDYKTTGELLKSEPVKPRKNVELISRNSLSSCSITNCSRELQWLVKPEAGGQMVIEFQTKTFHLE